MNIHFIFAFILIHSLQLSAENGTTTDAAKWNRLCELESQRKRTTDMTMDEDNEEYKRLLDEIDPVFLAEKHLEAVENPTDYGDEPEKQFLPDSQKIEKLLALDGIQAAKVASLERTIGDIKTKKLSWQDLLKTDNQRIQAQKERDTSYENLLTHTDTVDWDTQQNHEHDFPTWAHSKDGYDFKTVHDVLPSQPATPEEYQKLFLQPDRHALWSADYKKEAELKTAPRNWLRKGIDRGLYAITRWIPFIHAKTTDHLDPSRHIRNIYSDIKQWDPFGRQEKRSYAIEKKIEINLQSIINRMQDTVHKNKGATDLLTDRDINTIVKMAHATLGSSHKVGFIRSLFMDNADLPKNIKLSITKEQLKTDLNKLVAEAVKNSNDPHGINNLWNSILELFYTEEGLAAVQRENIRQNMPIFTKINDTLQSVLDLKFDDSHGNKNQDKEDLDTLTTKLQAVTFLKNELQLFYKSSGGNWDINNDLENLIKWLTIVENGVNELKADKLIKSSTRRVVLEKFAIDNDVETAQFALQKICRKINHPHDLDCSLCKRSRKF